VVESVLIIKSDVNNINLINFNVIFLFSFFLCTYAYPILLIDSNSLIGDILKATLLSMNTMNRCVSLSTLGISVYGYAYLSWRKQEVTRPFLKNEIVKAIRIEKVAKPILIVMCFLLCYHLLYFLKEHKGENVIEVNDAPYLFYFFYIVLSIYSLFVVLKFRYSSRSIKISTFIKNNKAFFLAVTLIVFLFIIIGDRMPIITILMTIIVAIALYLKRLKIRQILFIGLLGTLFMFALRETRTGSSSIKAGGVSAFLSSSEKAAQSAGNVLDVFSDLIGINFELNSGMYVVDRGGCIYPWANALINVASPIPLLPTYLVKFFYNKEPRDVTPGPTIARYTGTNPGNHCIIDLYMPFGVFGVVLGFYILGWIVAKVSNNLGKSLFYSAFYCKLVSAAVFIPRNSITNIYREFVFMFATFVLLDYITRKYYARRRTRHQQC
jgi:hypothetical protein